MKYVLDSCVARHFSRPFRSLLRSHLCREPSDLTSAAFFNRSLTTTQSVVHRRTERRSYSFFPCDSAPWLKYARRGFCVSSRSFIVDDYRRTSR